MKEEAAWKEQWEYIVENLAEGVIVVNRAGIIMHASAAAEKLFGLARSDIIGRAYSDPARRMIAADGKPLPNKEHLFSRAMKTGEPIYDVEIIIEHLDGTRLIALVNSIPLRGEEGAIVGVALSFNDITERKRENELSDSLNDIGAIINSMRDFDEIMQTVAVESAKAMGCESTAIEVREDNRWPVRYLHGLPQGVLGTPLSTDEEAPVAKLAVRAGKPVVVNDAFADGRVDSKLMERRSIRSFLAVPLIIRDEAIGALIFSYHSAPVAFNKGEVDFAGKLGASISLALENARLFSAQRNIADILQDALLIMPRSLLRLEFGHLYRSATEAARVGGDFYDLFELEYDKVAIVLGDVSGHGIEAATLTSLVRSTIRAYAYLNETPALVMSKTNDAVKRVVAPAIFITVFLGILNKRSGALTYCSAGHPQAVLKRKTSEVSLLQTRSPVIGALAGLDYFDDEEVLEKGDILVLYTDGVIEARRDGEFFGEERLVDVITSLGSISARKMPRLIFDEVLQYTGGKLADDVALLTVSLEDDYLSRASSINGA